MMENIVLDFFKKHQISTNNTRVLLACSGGMDSMCLAHLFLKCDIVFGLAHVDHTTREGESYQDRLFVEDFAKKHQLPFFVKTINIEAEKKSTNESFQMIARRLRYDFLRSTAKEYEYQYIATAHHQDDNVETFLINLSRAKGISGLSGIQEKNDPIIRPLLHVTRESIRTFVYENKIAFREDATNFTNKYQRNKWRRSLLPFIHREYPHFSQNIAKSIDYLTQADDFIQETIQSWIDQYITLTDEGMHIPIDALKAHHNPSFLLFKILQPFGFNYTNVSDALSFQQVGKSCENHEYILRLERNSFLMIKKKDDSNKKIVIPVQEGVQLPYIGTLRILNEESESLDGLRIPKDWISELTIRHWQPGDRFIPVGMNGKSKKLKKFFVDEKYSTTEKNNQWLLLYKERIIWVVGRRKAIIPESSEYVFLVFE